MKSKKKMNKAEKIRMRNKNKKKSLKRVKMNLKMKMKSQILLLLKMTIKILKESEKFVSMTKKLKNTQKRRVIWKSKEIR